MGFQNYGVRTQLHFRLETGKLYGLGKSMEFSDITALLHKLDTGKKLLSSQTYKVDSNQCQPQTL